MRLARPQSDQGLAVSFVVRLGRPLVGSCRPATGVRQDPAPCQIVGRRCIASNDDRGQTPGHFFQHRPIAGRIAGFRAKRPQRTDRPAEFRAARNRPPPPPTSARNRLRRPAGRLLSRQVRVQAIGQRSRCAESKNRIPTQKNRHRHFLA